MTTKYRTRGFVFKKDEKAEADQSFAVFTKDFGRIELKARAIRKITSKLRSDIDIFYLSEIEFIQGEKNRTLTDAIKINKFEPIIRDSKKTEIACQISDVLDNFIKGQEKDEQTFYLLGDMFHKLSDSKFIIKNHQLIFQYFFWNFLSLQGYHLQVDSCVSCKDKLNPAEVYFSAKNGGTVCKKCFLADRDIKKINADTVKVLRLILKKDWRVISKLKIDLCTQKLLDEISKNIMAFCIA